MSDGTWIQFLFSVKRSTSLEQLSFNLPRFLNHNEGKEKVAKVIPNAILITTETDKNFLTSFASRDKAYVILFRLWQNALMDKPMNPQELWQSVNNFLPHLILCDF